MAKKLISGVEDEIFSLISCTQCYEMAYNRPDDSFVIPCDPPHILIWADCPDIGYWPAKIMSFDKQKMVNVRFFGDYTHLDIPSSACQIFCKDVESSKNGQPDGSCYDLAVQVYIYIYFYNMLTLGAFNSV